MNKRDIINLIFDRLEELDTEQNPIARHYAIAAAYADCKYTASTYGYSNGCFDDLWHKAVDMHARKLNIHPDPGTPGRYYR